VESVVLIFCCLLIFVLHAVFSHNCHFPMLLFFSAVRTVMRDRDFTVFTCLDD